MKKIKNFKNKKKYKIFPDFQLCKQRAYMIGWNQTAVVKENVGLSDRDAVLNKNEYQGLETITT